MLRLPGQLVLVAWVVVSVIAGGGCWLSRRGAGGRGGYPESWCLFTPWVLADANTSKSHLPLFDA
jgi:hypothetical protein